MKIKDGFVKTNIADQCVVIPVGDKTIDFRCLITLNETGEFLWDILQDDVSEDILVNKMLSEYDVSEDEARSDISCFIEELNEKNLLQ